MQAIFTKHHANFSANTHRKNQKNCSQFRTSSGLDHAATLGVGTSQQSTDMFSRCSVKASKTSVESRQITEFVRLRIARSLVERKDCNLTANGNHVQKVDMNGFLAQVVSILVSTNSESPCCSAKARGLNFIHCSQKSTRSQMHRLKFQGEKQLSGSTPRDK